MVQNLPYGTHILKVVRDVPNGNSPYTDYTIDGIALNEPDTSNETYGTIEEVEIFQPKMPPIPDDACIIADYMLMADFKPQTSPAKEKISKGVRRQNISRDVFFDETDGDSFTFAQNGTFPEGFVIHLSGGADSDTSMKMRIPSFGTNYVQRGLQSDSRVKLFIGDTDKDSSATKDNTDTYGSYAHLTSDLALGVYNFGANAVSGQNGNMSSFDIVTPIHTSHHYKTFETPFLHELIGGDRNMEQTHLICSPDGKTWDEVTRDTSYLGPSTQLIVASDGGNWNNSSGLTDHRGYFSRYGLGNKNIAWGYDRAIILEDGVYEIHCIVTATGGNADLRIQRNNTTATQNSSGTQYFSITNDRQGGGVVVRWDLLKGDYIYLNEAGAGTIYGGNQETGAKLIITKMS